MENFDYRNYLKNNPLTSEKPEDKMITENINEDARTDAEQEGYKDGFNDAKKDVKDALSKMKVSELKQKIRERILSELEEAESPVLEQEEEEEEEEVEVEADEEGDEEVEVETDVEADTESPGEVNPSVKTIQDLLTKAQATSKELGDEKLLGQIGNTITYFTRAHVVGDVGKVEENITELEDAIPDQAQLKINQEVKDAPSFAKAIVDFAEELLGKEQQDFFKNDTIKRAFNILRPLADKAATTDEKEA